MNEQTIETKSETNVEVVCRLLKNGGYLLVAGGSVDSLPDKIRNHPQIILWDDNSQGVTRKEVPSNTRAILYNRWVSHATAHKLRFAAQKLNIPTFPMLKTREIKDLLTQMILEQEPVPTITTETIEVPEPLVDETQNNKGYLTKEEMMRKWKKGEQHELILKLLKDSDFDMKYIDVTKRLLPIISGEYHIKTTEASMAQAVRVVMLKTGRKKLNQSISRGMKGLPKSNVEKEIPELAVATSSDDFAEAEKLLKDARAALDLFLDFIPKLRKEILALRKKQQKIRELMEN